MDIPEAMIEEQVQQMTDEFAQRLSYQGLSMEQYLMFSGMDAQKFADDLKPQAVKRIETRLVLEAIAKAENITASEEDFKAELEKDGRNVSDGNRDSLKDHSGSSERTR